MRGLGHSRGVCKGCRRAGLGGLEVDAPHTLNHGGMGSGGAQEGFVLVWALGLEGDSQWGQRGRRDLCGLGWVSVRVR